MAVFRLNAFPLKIFYCLAALCGLHGFCAGENTTVTSTLATPPLSSTFHISSASMSTPDSFVTSIISRPINSSTTAKTLLNSLNKTEFPKSSSSAIMGYFGSSSFLSNVAQASVTQISISASSTTNANALKSLPTAQTTLEQLRSTPSLSPNVLPTQPATSPPSPTSLSQTGATSRLSMRSSSTPSPSLLQPQTSLRSSLASPSTPSSFPSLSQPQTSLRSSPASPSMPSSPSLSQPQTSPRSSLASPLMPSSTLTRTETLSKSSIQSPPSTSLAPSLPPSLVSSGSTSSSSTSFATFMVSKTTIFISSIITMKSSSVEIQLSTSRAMPTVLSASPTLKLSATVTTKLTGSTPTPSTSSSAVTRPTTSISVSDIPKVFVIEASISREWKNDYALPYTKEFKELKKELENDLTKEFERSYGENFLHLEITSISEGSVKFQFKAYFKSSARVDDESLSKNIENVKTVSLPGIKVIKIQQTGAEETKSDKSTMEPWLIVLIVAIAFFVVYTIVLVVLVVKLKRSKRRLILRNSSKSYIDYKDATFMNMHSFIDDQADNAGSGGRPHWGNEENGREYNLKTFAAVGTEVADKTKESSERIENIYDNALSQSDHSFTFTTTETDEKKEESDNEPTQERLDESENGSLEKGPISPFY